MHVFPAQVVSLMLKKKFRIFFFCFQMEKVNKHFLYLAVKIKSKPELKLQIIIFQSLSSIHSILTAHIFLAPSSVTSCIWFSIAASIATSTGAAAMLSSLIFQNLHGGQKDYM